MSVNYESAIIYGIKCNPSAWDYEEREYMEDKGWDIVYDGYSDDFLYIGKLLSHACLGEEAQHEISGIYNFDIAEIIDDIPDNIFHNAFAEGGAFPRLYHICYAT